MRSALKKLIGLSAPVGRRTDFVQAGGGNTSVKTMDGKQMLIKASGARLADIGPETGWVALDLRKLQAIMDDPALAKLEPHKREKRVLEMLMASRAKPKGRPSVESSLHAMLDRYVVHTHPIAITALVSSARAEKLVGKLSAKIGREILWVPCTDPGYTLARAMKNRIDRYRRRTGALPRVSLIGNHGLIISSPDYNEARRMTATVVTAALELMGGEPEVTAPAPAGANESASAAAIVRGALYKALGRRSLLRLETGPLARWLASTRGATVARITALTPDEIVYCRRRALLLPARALKTRDPLAAVSEPVKKYADRFGFAPKIVLLPGVGFAAIGAAPKALDASIETYLAAVRAKRIAGRSGAARPLPPARASFLEKWEVENYRSSLMDTGGARPLEGRIAFVTGAASGLGKGLALGLARAGAFVGCADIDTDGLEATVNAMEPGQGLALYTNVTSEQSVMESFAKLAATFGGLDVLINAAGIAPAHPLADFPVNQWRLTLEINLTGYFLCSREAARVFAKQGAGGSIINISSKTGLQASVNNTAYNATKAGEIHLARGWALELGKHGVRVNAIAPGNVFKGSKIWNPTYIRAAAKKRGLKPDEVIPYYVSLSALKKEILPEDVVDGAVFLASDAAAKITGQALVIDGGQVLVR